MEATSSPCLGGGGARARKIEPQSEDLTKFVLLDRDPIGS